MRDPGPIAIQQGGAPCILLKECRHVGHKAVVAAACGFQLRRTVRFRTIHHVMKDRLNSLPTLPVQRSGDLAEAMVSGESLTPQGDHRVDPRGIACRQVAGEQRNGGREDRGG
jgi:hypothetical protein